MFGCGRGALVQCSEAAVAWSWCGVQSSQRGVLASSGRSPRAEPLTATCAEVVVCAVQHRRIGLAAQVSKLVEVGNHARLRQRQSRGQLVGAGA